jgi:hypothetical protein
MYAPLSLSLSLSLGKTPTHLFDLGSHQHVGENIVDYIRD